MGRCDEMKDFRQLLREEGGLFERAESEILGRILWWFWEENFGENGVRGFWEQ